MKNIITGFIILIAIVLLSNIFPFDKKNTKSNLKNNQKVTPKHKILKITETSNLFNDFNIYFCINGYLNWKTSAHGSTDIQWSYKIKNKHSEYISDQNLNLDVLEFGHSPWYEKKSKESSWCYNINLYYQLKKIPKLKYQGGYSRTSQPKLYEAARQEREQLYSSIESVTIRFYDSINKKELLSFSTSPL